MEKKLGKFHKFVNTAGNFLVKSFHILGLFVIGGATVWAASLAFIGMVQKGGATVEDLLLLFIYLEIGAMVGIYFQTNHMPVRFIIYIAITAMTRHLVGFVESNHQPQYDLLIMAGAIFILSISVLVLRYGSFTFPSDKPLMNINNDKKTE